MLEISIFFRGLLKKKRLALFRIRGTPSFLKVFIILGLITIFLPLAWPRLFFPLIWLCFIFLLEPINFWLKNETLLEDMEKKEWSKFWSWILAGLVAGFFWEFWNFWAGSHWEYFIPYLNFWKVFQMPVFGFTGFMPFALEVFAIYQLLLFVYKKLQKKIVLQCLIVILLLLFYAGAFYLIDSFTLVHWFKTWIIYKNCRYLYLIVIIFAHYNAFSVDQEGRIFFSFSFFYRQFL